MLSARNFADRARQVPTVEKLALWNSLGPYLACYLSGIAGKACVRWGDVQSSSWLASLLTPLICRAPLAVDHGTLHRGIAAHEDGELMSPGEDRPWLYEDFPTRGAFVFNPAGAMGWLPRRVNRRF